MSTADTVTNFYNVGQQILPGASRETDRSILLIGSSWPLMIAQLAEVWPTRTVWYVPGVRASAVLKRFDLEAWYQDVRDPPGDQFDSVSVDDYLLRNVEPTEAMKRIRSPLRPTGRAFAICPNVHQFSDLESLIANDIRTPYPIREQFYSETPRPVTRRFHLRASRRQWNAVGPAVNSTQPGSFRKNLHEQH